MNPQKMMIGLSMVLMTLFNNPSAFGEARLLTMAISLSLPPYTIAETNSGMEFEIVREALRIKGYTMKPKYVPFARLKAEVANQTVDGAFPITADSGTRAFYSVVHMIYENVAVSLQKNHFGFENIQALADKRIVAFQDAPRYLGKAYAAMANANPRYKEITNQELQINLLYTGRCDAIILDKNIFQYFRLNNKQVDTSQAVTIHHIFETTPYSVAFTDEKICNDFNDGLKQLRESGRYRDIILKYIGQ